MSELRGANTPGYKGAKLTSEEREHRQYMELFDMFGRIRGLAKSRVPQATITVEFEYDFIRIDLSWMHTGRALVLKMDRHGVINLTHGQTYFDSEDEAVETVSAVCRQCYKDLARARTDMAIAASMDGIRERDLHLKQSLTGIDIIWRRENLPDRTLTKDDIRKMSAKTAKKDPQLHYDLFSSSAK